MTSLSLPRPRTTRSLECGCFSSRPSSCPMPITTPGNSKPSQSPWRLLASSMQPRVPSRRTSAKATHAAREKIGHAFSNTPLDRSREHELVQVLDSHPRRISSEGQARPSRGDAASSVGDHPPRAGSPDEVARSPGVFGTLPRFSSVGPRSAVSRRSSIAVGPGSEGSSLRKSSIRKVLNPGQANGRCPVRLRVTTSIAKRGSLARVIDRPSTM